ncbi:phosphoserine phosphatase SerB [Colwellia demingiae]|uniref:Phosphoserine phosphatase n=1 Tax=Colwellia demingiae TaxID=89401 RepID=A0A5C6QKU3_9GAMM|nr:phosphoserine phosphatase SerB [Colwellia demingiae]TWX69846.1 phosphoserine phosphatase SerB [Colwellia demingiae]
MSFITTILPLSLEQYLANNLQDKQLPIAFSLSEQALTLADGTLREPTTEEQIELVVFQELPLSQLLALQNYAQLSIITLTTINHRNNQTSCRFQVSCSDFIKTRKAVADFALANKIEAALLTQVPKLEVPGLLVMDMDSTTIEIECIDEIAKLAGVGEEVAEVTERAMLGELDFAQSLHQRVATLAESPESILSDVAKNIPLMAGLKPLIVELKKHNWRIAIASGGFTYFADHLKETLNLDAAFANTLEIIDGKLTGKVLGNVVDAQVKADSLAILSKEYQIPDKQTVAMGDGANDLVMMAAASFGVAFHAKPIVLAQADISINEQGLDCLLHWLA